VKLLLDEHLGPAIAEELRRRSNDVVTVVEAGLAGQTDATLLEAAVSQRRAVVTANYADFRGLHERYLSRRQRHFGIVVVPRRFSLAEAGVGRLIGAIERLLVEHPEDAALENVEIWLTET
jgi:hypothetical protein